MTVETLTARLLYVLEANAVWATMLFAIVLPVTFVLRRAAPQIRQALWVIVLARLVLPPGLALPVSATTLIRSIPAAYRVDESMRVTLYTVARAGGDHSSSTVASVMAALWLAGFALTATFLLRRRLALVRLAATAARVDDRSLVLIVEQWRERYAIRREVRLVRADSRAGAFTIGTRRPVVVLPDQLVEHLSPAAIECVIAHELAHVRRFDDLALTLQAVIQSLYFFHPVAWIAGAMRASETELASDQLALSAGDIEARDYGRSILDVMRLGVEPFPGPSTFLGRQRRITMRIESLVNARPSNRFLTFAAVFLGIFVLPMADLPEAAETRLNRRSETTAGDAPTASTPDASKPVRVEGDIVPPKVVNKVEPIYPEEARAAKERGIVIVEATINKHGVVTDVRVKETPREDFAKATVDAVRQWTFEPATLKGKPVAVFFTMTVRFELK